MIHVYDLKIKSAYMYDRIKYAQVDLIYYIDHIYINIEFRTQYLSADSRSPHLNHEDLRSCWLLAAVQGVRPVQWVHSKPCVDRSSLEC